MRKNSNVINCQKLKSVSHSKSESYSSITDRKTLSVDVQEKIRDYLRKDLEIQLPKLKLKHSRDLSHLKDHRLPKVHSNPCKLPKNIQDLKVFIDTKPYSTLDFISNQETHRSLSSSLAIKDSDIAYLEKLDLGPPTGRKEAENLSEWFEEMKSKYENDESFEVVIIACIDDLVRQIKVDCKDRGDLLQKILSYYSNMFKQKEKAYEENKMVLESSYEKKVYSMKLAHTEEIEKYKKKVEEMAGVIRSCEESIYQFQQEVGIYKKRFFDVQQTLLNERKRSIIPIASDFFVDSQGSLVDIHSIPVPKRSPRPRKTDLNTAGIGKEVQSPKKIPVKKRNSTTISLIKSEKKIFPKFREDETQTDPIEDNKKNNFLVEELVEKLFIMPIVKDKDHKYIQTEVIKTPKFSKSLRSNKSLNPVAKKKSSIKNKKLKNNKKTPKSNSLKPDDFKDNPQIKSLIITEQLNTILQKTSLKKITPIA
jgi:hypothetical protein